MGPIRDGLRASVRSPISIDMSDVDDQKVHPPSNPLQMVFSVNAVLVVGTCAGYLAASSLLILLNKFLLSEDGFAYPLMLSGSGMFVTCIGSSVMVRIPAIVPEQQAVTRETYTQKILPLGLCSAATLALGNMAYLYLEVGLVQMLKSCCPVFVLFVALALRLERFSLPLITAVALIAGGTALTAATGVTKISGVGLVIQLLSEMCEALRLCLAQLLMCNMRLHQFEALRQMSSACVLFLCVGVWLLEWERFWHEEAWRRVLAHPHWYLAAASLGFGLNLLAFAVIKLTGSVTQKVLGTVKNVMLVVFSVLFMGEQVSWRQWLGYQGSLVGFVWYQQQKMAMAARDANNGRSAEVEVSTPEAAAGPPHELTHRIPRTRDQPVLNTP
eukprot:jgi/Ulvmu1/6179/UM028_0035.1